MGDTESLRVYPRNFVPDAANESQMLCKGKRKYALNVSNQQAQPIVLIASREYFAQSQRPPLMGYDLLLGGNPMTLIAAIASKAEQPSLNRYTTWLRQSTHPQSRWFRYDDSAHGGIPQKVQPFHSERVVLEGYHIDLLLFVQTGH
jgi:hypothetical protein